MNKKHNNIVGRKIGTVTISMYKENTTNLPIFYIQADNEDVLQVAYIIEDSLYDF